MDNLEFFREATLKICGIIDIDKALYGILKYLQKYIPVNSMNLAVWEPEIHSIRIIARATNTEGFILDTPVSMKGKARKYMEEMYERFKSSKWMDADIVNDSTADPGMREVTKEFNLKKSSLMHLILETTDRPLCSVLLITEGKNVYTQKHADILNLLKEPFSLAMSNALKHRKLSKLKDKLADDNKYLNLELRELSGTEIIGAKFGLKDIVTQAKKASSVDSPVLLLGETGVGKDVIANAIHFSSNRKDKPFIKVNCGAILETLVDSELFGHEKGAFTGALAQKRGKFERANEGTIFLDEIGELKPDVQVRLLRVLQEKEIERIGGISPIKLNIRIIAATNCDLEEMIKNKKFRDDLWFRINVFPIKIPPLRERKIDIPALVQHFISLKAKELKLPLIPTVDPNSVEKLMQYDWPGNIRELQNLIERELIINPAGPLTFDHLNLSQQEKSNITSNNIIQSDNLDQLVIHHIQSVLQKTNGKIHGQNGAAELLGLNPNTLRNRMNKLGIKYLKNDL